MNYAIFLPPASIFASLKLPTIPSRASLESITNPNFLALNPQFVKIGYASQSLITRYPKALIKRKYKGDRAVGGEGKVLPCLIQSMFERDWTTLPLASGIGVEEPIKDSNDEDLKGMDTNQGWREESPWNAVQMRVGRTKRWRNLWLCLYFTKD